MSNDNAMWVASESDGSPCEQLRVGRRVLATVWSNGVWHTWDANGSGGENSSEQSVDRAKCEAVVSMFRQHVYPRYSWFSHSARTMQALLRGVK